MSNVMPSQVVNLIEKLFPHVTSGPRSVGLDTGHIDHLQAIVNLIREIPAELINVPTDQYADLVVATAIIEGNRKLRNGRGGDFRIQNASGADVATVLHRVLSQCPDEFPPAQTIDLLFVTAVDLRESIRQDIGAIDMGHRRKVRATIPAGRLIGC